MSDAYSSFRYGDESEPDPVPAYLLTTVDGDEIEITPGDETFIANGWDPNEHELCGGDDARAIRALLPGETYQGFGFVGARFSVTRKW
jgi:hypothetical protein